MTYDKGEYIPLQEGGPGGPVMLDELFFGGHCSEDDLDWEMVQEETDHLEVPVTRDEYTTIQHVYARRVPWDWDRGCGGGDDFMWQWQRYPGRGAFPVTMLMERCEVQARRLRRRRRRAIKRQILRRYPEAFKITVYRNDVHHKASFCLPEIKGDVTWRPGATTVGIQHRDIETWKALYQGRRP